MKVWIKRKDVKKEYLVKYRIESKERKEEYK